MSFSVDGRTSSLYLFGPVEDSNVLASLGVVSVHVLLNLLVLKEREHKHIYLESTRVKGYILALECAHKALDEIEKGDIDTAKHFLVVSNYLGRFFRGLEPLEW